MPGNNWQKSAQGGCAKTQNRQGRKMIRRRWIRSAKIPTTWDNRYRTIIHHSTARQMERLYNTLPYRLQNIRGVKTDISKRHLDRWLRDIPDAPKIDNLIHLCLPYLFWGWADSLWLLSAVAIHLLWGFILFFSNKTSI